MEKIINYCLDEIGCKKKGIHVREVPDSPVITPLAAACAGGVIHASAAKEILGEVTENINDPAVLFKIAERYSSERGYDLSRADNILCYSVPDSKPSDEAVRLTGDEPDALFSDLKYLVGLGPVFGVIKDGKVVSLAGAVDRGSVYEAHIETAPSERKKGFAAACLRSLAHAAEKPLLYRCREINRASDSTVRSVGGVLLLSYRAFTARR